MGHPLRDVPTTDIRRLCFEGAWFEADHPEDLPVWQEFDRQYGTSGS